ncbi:hypothetical protein GCM10011375_30740 [Hymenobacter qilianensis]|uniref:Uncharacterized protein n=2 Tax=Hymenobacter qilianensis TaxID=1385715 RepID=A0ACB5PUN1_9BACT|nr:DUF6544 family protein [Hymenobacter qilianensis]QNP51616.1 hypothetical protein H9L05_16750 [Hymenobacter qilianensis]GGF73503.1 hypothetical protein GCM10011375_30740 [Hymenobacter qilianensis]
MAINENKPWLLVSGVLAAAAAGFGVGRALVGRQLRQDARRLLRNSTDVTTSIYHETQLADLPAPVQRYFRHVLPNGQPYLRSVRLRHTGQFKTSLDGDWGAISGQEYLTADPPGFIWQGTTTLFAARDEYVAGRGQLLVRLFGLAPVMCGRGPRYDRAELMRWLGELAWLPTALLPSERVSWMAQDEHSATLTFTYQGQAISYLVRFNERNELVQCEAERYQSDTAALPWVGRFAEYQTIRGVRVPTQAEASWIVDGQPRPYARFQLLELEYNQTDAY